jgi:hypothetical protein
MLKSSIDNRPVWNAPKLQELGNLRMMVRVGGAGGKSGILSDGKSCSGGEAMVNQDNGPCQ